MTVNVTGNAQIIYRHFIYTALAPPASSTYMYDQQTLLLLNYLLI
jgi:hypothetical protein